MESPEKIKCPIFTVWSILILNIYFIDSYILSDCDGNSRNCNKKRILNIPRPESLILLTFFLILLLIIILIDLIGTIFVTISFEKNKYSFYLAGLIMTSIFSLIMTIMLILYGNGNTALKIFQAIVECSQIFVLFIYNKRVKSSFKYSHLNDNMISDFPKESLPLRQQTKQEGEQDIYI